MFPDTVCYLTDEYGNILNPLSPGSIHYIEQKSTDRYLTAEKTHCLSSRKTLTVWIQGYLTIFADGMKSTSPIPFCIIRDLILTVPKNASVSFATTDFHCRAIPMFRCDDHIIENVKIFVEVSASAISSQSNSLFMLPPAKSALGESNPTLFYAEKVIDACRFKGNTIVTSNQILKAETSYYIALSSGDKKDYTDQDSLPDYRGCEIPAPETVSYYNLFVNGMVQPRTNYTIRKGCLTFNTKDSPSKDVLIILEFITYKNKDGVLPAEVDYYVTRSKGNQRIFRNTDALPIYGSKGIPDPEAVSYYEFYINGVLQPKTNYMIKQGQLELVSADLPQEESFLVLESVTLKTSDHQTLHAKLEHYNALSNSGKIYTDYDELKMYSSLGIPAPQSTSYQKLLINSVLQPPVNYTVQKGLIRLITEDAPIENAPLTLQSITFLLP